VRLVSRGRPSVITIENVRECPAHARGAFLTIGNFDGVHRGHQQLLSLLRAQADARGVPAIALTFNPHPVALLRPDKAPVPLVWPEREVELLKKAGADEVGVFKTGSWLLELSAREFFDQVIRDQFQAVGLVEGPNFAFGRDRRGDVHSLAGWCREAGLTFEVVEPTQVEGHLVSSSRIRECLSAGDVVQAAELLTRPHRIRGIVTHGAARGAGLGFPTANLDGIDTLIPPDGVYACRAWIEDRAEPLAAACNIGPNPTFGEQVRKVEAHLLDFAGDLYGRRVEIDFLARIRETRPFRSLEELLGQIQRDVEETRRIALNAR
jgi:riboflavin kinase/FMN adenylyltransferase